MGVLNTEMIINEDLTVFTILYDNIANISELFYPDIKYGKVIHRIGRTICDPNHNFAVIQGTDCVTDCLHFCTLWEGVFTYICVCR